MGKKITAILVAVIILLLSVSGLAESVWVLCNPKSYVNVRLGSSKKSMLIGTLECGQPIETDWKEKNGWVHIYTDSCECGEGWIRKGYVTEQAPVIEPARTYRVASNYPVLCRNMVNGRVIKKLHNDDTVVVYSFSDWAVTSKGYIKMEYLEVSGDD